MLNSFLLFTNFQMTQWLPRIVQSWPNVLFLVVSLEAHWSYVFCILRMLRKPSSTCLAIRTMHFTYMLGKPVISHLFFPSLLPTCIYHFRFDCLGVSFMEKLLYLDWLFYYSFFSIEVNSSKLNSLMRFYFVLHCILLGKVYAILENLMCLLWGPSNAHQIVGRLLNLPTM